MQFPCGQEPGDTGCAWETWEGEHGQDLELGWEWGLFSNLQTLLPWLFPPQGWAQLSTLPTGEFPMQTKMICLKKLSEQFL